MRVCVGGNLSQVDSIFEELRSSSKKTGAIILFIGLVREESRGKNVSKLVYEAQEDLAKDFLLKLAESIRDKYGLMDIVIEHRTGELNVGEKTIIVGVASRHRKEGLLALDEILDSLKAGVPIWKKEITDEGAHWIKDEHPKDLQVVVNGKEIEVKDKDRIMGLLKDLLSDHMCEHARKFRVKINISCDESIHGLLS